MTEATQQQQQQQQHIPFFCAKRKNIFHKEETKQESVYSGQTSWPSYPFLWAATVSLKVLARSMLEFSVHTPSWVVPSGAQPSEALCFICFFLLLRCTLQPVGFQFPNQGLNLQPLQWKPRVLTSGSPGTSKKGSLLFDGGWIHALISFQINLLKSLPQGKG